MFYEATSYAVKEYIVLKDSIDPNEFTFDLVLQGVTAKEADGHISFVDEQGTAIFWVAEPFAVDDAGVATKDVTCGVTENAGVIRLTVRVPETYLADAKRAYPVVIDPTIMISVTADTFDSYVSSRYPDTNYYLSEYIKTGRDDAYYTRRTYMKFNLPSLAPSKVTSAYLRINKYSGATPEVAAYRVMSSWSSSTVTWNSKPGYSTGDPSTYAYNDSGIWWRMDCMTMVQYWLGGTYSNCGSY